MMRLYSSGDSGPLVEILEEVQIGHQVFSARAVVV